MHPRFLVGGADITEFVDAWMHDLDTSDGSWLAQASLAPDDPDGYDLGMAALMAAIGGRVWGERGSHVELLLYAVLAVYQDHVRACRRTTWPGVVEHVVAAFEHVRRLGPRLCADQLRRGVGERAGWSTWAGGLVELSLRAPTPAERAAKEQQLAGGDLRDLRAARALDGREGDPWLSMPGLSGRLRGPRPGAGRATVGAAAIPSAAAAPTPVRSCDATA